MDTQVARRFILKLRKTRMFVDQERHRGHWSNCTETGLPGFRRPLRVLVFFLVTQMSYEGHNHTCKSGVSLVYNVIGPNWIFFVGSVFDWLNPGDIQMVDLLEDLAWSGQTFQWLLLLDKRNSKLYWWMSMILMCDIIKLSKYDRNIYC